MEEKYNDSKKDILYEYLNEDFDETAEESRNVFDSIDFTEFWAERNKEKTK